MLIVDYLDERYMINIRGAPHKIYALKSVVEMRYGSTWMLVICNGKHPLAKPDAG